MKTMNERINQETIGSSNIRIKKKTCVDSSPHRKGS